MHQQSSAPGADAVAPAAAAALTQRALRQLPFPVAVCDERARVVTANDAMSRLAGRPGSALVGRRIGEVVSVGPGEAVTLAEMAEQALRTRSLTQLTLRVRSSASGGRIWSITLSPLLAPDGRVEALSVAFVDVTQQWHARRRLAIVDRAGRRLGSTLDVARTAQELADLAADEFADFVTVDLLDSALDGETMDGAQRPGPLTYRRVAQQSVLDGCPESVVPLGRAHSYPDGSPPGLALRTGSPFRHDAQDPSVQRWLEQHPRRARSAREHGMHSAIGVPLRARGTTLGIVQFLRHRTPQPFDGDDLLLAQEIATRAAVCVDNARRYARERSAALALRRSLLPRLPRQEAVETASRYLPAGAGAGGDWFDVIPLSGSRVALVIGDVAGHGIPAAATMGKLSTAVRTLADIDMPPDELLTHLDDLVIGLQREHGSDRTAAHPADETGATCLYAVYDPVAAHCTVARAGHPPPALVTPDGRVSLPELPAGPPLGLGGIPFEAGGLHVPGGSLLAFFTDGLLAGGRQDIDVGLGILRAALQGRTTSLEDTCDSVIASAREQQPSDDLALLLARTRVLDASHVATWNLPAEPVAVRHARELTGRQLDRWGLEDLAFTTELIVSELVTNAIRHGAPPLRLRLVRGAALTCEVSDGGSAVPRMRRARGFEEDGRGLLVVARTADRWGSRHVADGKVIWTEQFLDGAAATAGQRAPAPQDGAADAGPGDASRDGGRAAGAS